MEAPTKGTFRLAGREFPKVTWYKDKGLRRYYLCLMLVVLTSATNGYDGSIVNALQSMPTWQAYFDNPRGSMLGLFAAIMSVGSITAIPFVPYIADILGRRMGIMIGCLIMLLGVVLQSISINFRMFIAARFFLGFGVAIAHGSSPLLITELAHPQHRAIFTTIYNTTWYFGSFFAAWICLGTSYIGNNWDWRVPSILQGLPSIIQLIFVWFVPGESFVNSHVSWSGVPATFPLPSVVHLLTLIVFCSDSPRWLIARVRYPSEHKKRPGYMDVRPQSSLLRFTTSLIPQRAETHSSRSSSQLRATD